MTTDKPKANEFTFAIGVKLSDIQQERLRLMKRLPTKKVVGMAGILDTSRFKYFFG